MAMTGSERAQLEAALTRANRQADRITALEATVAALVQLLKESRTQIFELTAANAHLARQLKTKDAEIAALTARMLRQGKNSRNSSVPPSADPTHAPMPPRRYPTRSITGRAAGGQPGHAGVGATFTDQPDLIVEHRPQVCPNGHVFAADLAGTVGEARQVIEVTVLKTVTEHRLVQLTCAQCVRAHVPVSAARTAGVFPEGVTGRVCYGPGVRRAALLAACGGQLPARVAVGLTNSLYGTKVTAGTLDTWRGQLAETLTSFDTLLIRALQASPVLGADETPIRLVGMANAHIHTVQSALLTRFHLAGRSKNDIVAGEVLDGYAGVLTHDGLSSYWSVTTGLHQLCWAHLIRDLRFHDQAHQPNDKEVAHPWPRYAELAALASLAIHHRNTAATAGSAGGDGTHDLVRDQFMTALDAALVELERAVPRRGSTLQDGLLLLRRLHRCRADLWHFLDDYQIPPTNNASEQALRMWKVRQRRSGTFRSADAARQWLLLGSYLDSCRKNGLSAELALDRALDGEPWLPTVPAAGALVAA